MARAPTEYNEKYLPVQVCVNCGHVSKRSDLDALPNPSGIFKCPACGSEGRLNIEIRELEIQS